MLTNTLPKLKGSAFLHPQHAFCQLTRRLDLLETRKNCYKLEALAGRHEYSLLAVRNSLEQNLIGQVGNSRYYTQLIKQLSGLIREWWGNG